MILDVINTMKSKSKKLTQMDINLIQFIQNKVDETKFQVTYNVHGQCADIQSREDENAAIAIAVDRNNYYITTPFGGTWEDGKELQSVISWLELIPYLTKGRKVA